MFILGAILNRYLSKRFTQRKFLWNDEVSVF